MSQDGRPIGGVVMRAAGYFWSNDSFNSLFSFMSGIVAVLLAGWLSYVIANPRRRLSWRASSGTSMLPDDAPNVQVFSDGVPVAKPRFCRLSIKNEGRKAIIPQEFHSGDDSLVFDLGQPVISVTPEVHPTLAPTPPTSLYGNRLHIGPSLIQPKQVVHLLILLDGDEESVDCVAGHIIGTPVIKSRKEITDAVSSRRDMLNYVGIAAFLLVAALILLTHTPKDATCWARTPEGEKVKIVSSFFACDSIKGEERDSWPW